MAKTKAKISWWDGSAVKNSLHSFLAIVFGGVLLTGAAAQTETIYLYDENNRLTAAIRVEDPVSVQVGSNTALDLNGSSLSLSNGQSYINAYPFDVSITIDVVAGLQVLVDGVSQSLPTNGSTTIYLRPGQTIELSYSGAAPMITWSLDDQNSEFVVILVAINMILLN